MVTILGGSGPLTCSCRGAVVRYGKAQRTEGMDREVQAQWDRGRHERATGQEQRERGRRARCMEMLVWACWQR